MNQLLNSTYELARGQSAGRSMDTFARLTPVRLSDNLQRAVDFANTAIVAGIVPVVGGKKFRPKIARYGARHSCITK